jgi:hypothetical protein
MARQLLQNKCASLFASPKWKKEGEMKSKETKK